MTLVTRLLVMISVPLLVACGPAPESKADLQEEENKALVRRAFEALNESSLDVMDEIYDANHVKHTNGITNNVSLKEAKQRDTTLKAFPDYHREIEDMVAEGNKVSVRWTFTGTHKGELMGIPPTGVQVTMTAISIYRITDGKIMEIWQNSDHLGVMQQLGVIPPIGQGEE
ncbi:MAG: ester cyclase [Chloroflexi bacterium]|jgi:predicted ester cyclase|nr:ester cyclase [Chloroflexota bacterium]